MVNISKILSLGKTIGKSISEVSSKEIETEISHELKPAKIIRFCGEESEKISPAVTTPIKSAVNTSKVSSEIGEFEKYPQEIKTKINKMRNFLLKLPKIANATGFIDNLTKYNSNYDLVLELIKSPKKLNAYCKHKMNLNKQFKNLSSKSFEEKELLAENIALMKIFNPQSYKALTQSKGFEEILKGKLNLAYISDIKPTDKIGEDYFYKLFENIEKNTSERLLKIKGLDKNIATKLLKKLDKTICGKPELAEKFISKLETTKNPELANRILKTFYIKNNLKTTKRVFEILCKADENPKFISKIMDLKGICLDGAKFITENLTKDTNVMSDGIFDYLVKFQQENSKICPPYVLNNANIFLRESKNDEQLLKQILEIAKSKNINVGDILKYTSENNIEYLRHNIKLDKLDDEIITKLSVMSDSEKFKDPKNWEIVDKAYNETYLPIQKIFKNKKDLTEGESCTAELLLDKSINNPEIYKKLKDLKVIDLIKEGKINPRIISNLREGCDFTPEIYEDLRKLINHEPLIKKFDNFDKILIKSKEGDVVSVQGKLYINNCGKLERWNMTEEKFNELFPLVDRFSGKQGLKDCYLITALDTLYRNPKSRGIYYKMFEEKNGDIFVTIPSYKDFQGTIKFPKGEIQTSPDAANAAKHVQMLEQTYSRTALRDGKNIPMGKDPLTTDDLDYLAKRNVSGQTGDVINAILCYKGRIPQSHHTGAYCYNLSNTEDLTKVKQIFENNSQNPKVIFNIGILKPGRKTGHALQVKSYNPDTKKLSIIDPIYGAAKYEKTVDELGPELHRVWTTVLK